jgi:hypothetical protein
MKDLIQEGRKIQEAFKKNVIEESQFKYNSRDGKIFRRTDNPKISIIELEYHSDSVIRTFFDKIKSKFTGEKPEVESVDVLKPAFTDRSKYEADFMKNQDFLDLSIRMVVNEKNENGSVSPRIYVINLDSSGNIVDSVKDYNFEKTALPKNPEMKKVVEDLSKRIFKEFHTGSTYKDIFDKMMFVRPKGTNYG